MSVTTTTNDRKEVRDPLDMSDEAFAEYDPSEYEELFGGEDADTQEDYATDESAEPEAEADESDATEEETNTDSDDTDETEEDDEADSDEDEADDAGDDSDPGSEEEAGEPEAAADKDAEPASVDFESEYTKLLTPFRANGKDMQVKTVDEARQLMQMGANYNKKMSALKPSLKTMKLLENNGLMGDEQISYLIDLHKGDKGAINKLIKDSGIDPLDMDSESTNDYKTETYTVDDREMALDEVLDRIQDTPTYSDTVNVVSTKWDKASQQHIANNPTALETINTHMASGVYERVNAEVEKQRTFGQLNGLSDIEAYHQVGYTMSEGGQLNDLAQKDSKAPAPKVVTKSKAKVDPKLKEKKRATSSTRNKPAANSSNDYDPLGMSDEAFEAEFNDKFL
jgi:hypothetical protein